MTTPIARGRGRPARDPARAAAHARVRAHLKKRPGLVRYGPIAGTWTPTLEGGLPDPPARPPRIAPPQWRPTVEAKGEVEPRRPPPRDDVGLAREEYGPSSSTGD
jgi:hypothetical protein